MKTRNLLSLLAIVIAIALVSSNLLAQDSTKTKEGKTIKTELNFKNEGETTQNRNEVRVNEGQGTMTRTQLYGEEKALKSFVDEDGDGINDNAVKSEDASALKQAAKKGNMNKFGGNKYGPGDGTGNDGVGPKDGTGYGPGDCTTPEAVSGTKRGGRK
ncbi:MAG: hypothetical protein MUO34_10095 [Ignavibacteriaceae bacterium]|nr:hypothetical protein [Ignavibacteriaceae bacterium]